MPLEPSPKPAALPLWGTALLGLYVSSIYAVLVAALFFVWPVVEQGRLQPLAPAWATGWTPTLDVRFLLVTALCGALGSYIHVATSFVEHVGQGRLSHPWCWWYLLRPTIGSCLALLVYFGLRAGLVTGTGEGATATLSPYGIAAMSGLSGLFSRQATEKLREVFENLFKTDPRA